MKSKTLQLIEGYTQSILNEQPGQNSGDATDISEMDTDMSQEPDTTVPPEAEVPAQMTSEGEKYLIDLLVKAFAHTPNDNELKIIDTISQQYKLSNPKEISDTIQKLLDGGNEEFSSTLGEI